jgi:outer membrane protein OmpA-like peptidoglycan-associated protein
MRGKILGLVLVAMAWSVPALAQDAQREMTKDQPGASDWSPAGRYEGSYLLAQTVKAFDELTLPSAAIASGKFKATASGQGKVTRSLYVAPKGRSTLEILANHKQALLGAGFKPVFECGGDACGEGFGRAKFDPNNNEHRVVVEKAGQTRTYLTNAMLEYVKDVRYGLYRRGDTLVGIYIAQMTGGSNGDSSAALSGYEGVLIESVEPKAMEQKIVTVTASEIDSKVAADGRAIFYGLFFDTDKADIKPESKPQLAEIAGYLAKRPALKAFIVGHTDNAGGLDYNLNLSLRRAQSVVNALQSQYKIASGRLTARGVGPLSPTATNRDDAGKAKNRRVELVEQGGQ